MDETTLYFFRIKNVFVLKTVSIRKSFGAPGKPEIREGCFEQGPDRQRTPESASGGVFPYGMGAPGVDGFIIGPGSLTGAIGVYAFDPGRPPPRIVKHCISANVPCPAPSVFLPAAKIAWTAGDGPVAAHRR